MSVDSRDIWVLLEVDADGKISAGLDALVPAGKLAAEVGSKVVAVIIGGKACSVAADAAWHGADKVITVEGEVYNWYTTDAYVSAFSYLADKYKPEVVLIPSSIAGCDLAPRAACRLKTGLVSKVTGCHIGSAGKVEWERPVFGGEAVATAVCAGSLPQMGLIAANVFKPSEADTSRQAELIEESYTPEAGSVRTLLKELIMNDNGGKLDLEDAEIVVAGGRGVGSEEGFAPLQELADLLGGTVAASRAVTDSGWAPVSSLVGQTGKTIAPKIYFACGISGALQHVCGMSGAGTIVAINRDPSAPIFEISDFGVVGDMFKVIPALIDAIKDLKK